MPELEWPTAKWSERFRSIARKIVKGNRPAMIRSGSIRDTTHFVPYQSILRVSERAQNRRGVDKACPSVNQCLDSVSHEQ